METNIDQVVNNEGDTDHALARVCALLFPKFSSRSIMSKIWNRLKISIAFWLLPPQTAKRNTITTRGKSTIRDSALALCSSVDSNLINGSRVLSIRYADRLA